MYFKVFIINLLFMVFKITAEQCQTPNNEFGECVPIKSCPPLLEMVKNRTTASIEFVHKSVCAFDGPNSTVCCNYQTEARSLINPIIDENNDFRIISNRNYCGYQHSDDYEHSNSSGSAITEFPWLARLVHIRNSTGSGSTGKLYCCAGSLITVRYVLTTADCTRIKPGGYTLYNVELGEYHVTNKTDCVEESSIQECSDPVRVYGLEKIIVHPQHSNTPVMNNIALLRLNGNAVFSDYVRPICLPYPDTISAEIGDTLTTTGWGFSSSKGERANIKKRVVSTVISNDACAVAYKKSQRIKITPSHLCSLEVENSTAVTCMGYSGAPVMFSNRFRWHQEGIVSNGKAQCGSNVPVIHTRVRKYLKWIEDNVEP